MGHGRGNPVQEKRPALLITRNLPPLVGGMERLNLHIAICLDRVTALSVIGPEGCEAHLPEQMVVKMLPVKPLWRFLSGALWSAWRMGRVKKPVYAVAGSGLTAPIAWLVARLSGGRAVVYLHGLDIVVKNAVYRCVWLPFIRRCDVVIVNSRNTAALAMAAGVDRRRLTVINPGTDIPLMSDDAGSGFRERYGLGARPLLLSVGRMTARKGLVRFAREALPEIVRRCPDVCLLIIGNAAPDALVGPGAAESAAFDQSVAELGLADNVMKLGVCNDETLSAAYQAAAVHVFPVLELPGDVEGFGMVALEAAAHGLPTVAFDVGGVGDAVVQGCSGYLVAPADYAVFSEQVLRVLEGDGGAGMREACRSFAQGRSWAVFERSLCQCLALPEGKG